MKRSLSSLIILVSCILLPQAAGTIEFIYTIKEKFHDQVGNTQPDTPIEWGFGAGASGDGQLTAVSVTLPGGGDPIAITGEDGGYDLDPDGFASKQALDIAYPNGSYSLSATDGGSPLDLGPFSLTGDAYPNTPHITNAVALESHDYSQDFLLTWNAFTGSDADDQVIIQIWNDTSNEEIVFEFLPRTATSFNIPGGTLTVDNYYEVDIIFVNETDGLENPETIIGYLSTTSFYLSTHTSDTVLSFSKWERNLQTAPGVVEEDGYRPLITVTGNSNTITFAQLVGPAVETVLSSNGPNSFLFVPGFDTKESFDAAYPAGEYYFGLTENGSFINYGPYDVPVEDAYPEPPLFQNFNELEVFDATQEQSISWSPAPAEVSLVQVFVLDESNNQVWSESAILPETTTAQIPANTLNQDTPYRLVVRFWNLAASIQNPPASLGYITSTYMPFYTSEDGGVGPIEGVDFLYALKIRIFQQYGNMAPGDPQEWDFVAGVNVDTVTGASLTYPGSEGPVSLPGEPGSYEFDDGITYDSQAALNAAIPDGGITLSITSPDETVGPFTITGDSYPNAPHILNAVALQSHDFENEDFTVLWNPFIGYTAEDRIVFEMYDDLTGDNLFFEFLDPSLTSFTIPAGTLVPDKMYEIGILFVKETSDASATADTLIGYASIINAGISTFQQPIEPDEVWLSRGISAEQTDATLPVSGEFIALAEAYGPGFSSATLLTPLPSEVPLPPWDPQFAPGEFELEETFATEGERDAAYPAGNYSVRIVNNGVTITHGPFNLSTGIQPVIPGITNWDAAQSVDPNQDFLLNWNAFSNAAASGFIEGELWNVNDPQNRMEWESGNGELGYLIPSDFLQPNARYTGELIFINPHPDILELDSSGVSITAAYDAFTTFILQTDDGTSVVDYPTWLTQYFSAEQLANPDIVGQDADPDRDGLSNYFEYLARLVPVDSSSKLVYTFSEDPDAKLVISPISGGVIWELRSSVDLLGWATVSSDFYQVVGNEIQIDLKAFLPATFFQIVLSSGGF